MISANPVFDNELARSTWIAAKLADLPSGQRILDAGAGEQQYKKYCNHLNYVSQDIAEYEGQGDAKGLHTGAWDTSNIDIVCDITAIPEPDGAFDAILCTEVLEHVSEPIAALRELSRLLKPGGRLILTAPFCSLTHFAPYHFASGFNRYFHTHHLERLGMRIEELSANGGFFDFLGQEIQRLPSVASAYGGRKLTRLEKLSASVLLRLLAKLRRQDRGSDELLCFGYHVVATKSDAPAGGA